MSSSLFTQLDLGKRAMMAQQSGMSTAGHNIANVDNPDYTRQRVDLEPQHPFRSRFGAGVDVQAVSQVADRFLNKRLIAEQSRGGNAEIREKGLKRMEALFSEVEGFGLRNALNQFWGAWGRLAAEPESEILRQNLLGTAQRMASRLNGLNHDFRQMRQEMNGRIAERVERVNQLAGQIAELNARIQQSDRGKGEANDLRDQREKALKELSKLVQIDWYENDKDKLLKVSIGNGFPLVTGRKANKLEASFASNEAGMFSLRGVDPRGISRDLTTSIQAGELKEYVSLRDDILVHFLDKLDEFASEVAFRVNRLHNSGTGLSTSVKELDSTFALKPDALARPLPFLKEGLFRIHLVDSDQHIVKTYEVPLHAGQDSVQDVVQRINQTVGDPTVIQARVNSDGSVTLEGQGDHRLVLGPDDTDFAATMGFNNFFENLQGARDFRVNPKLLEKPNLISTGKNLLPGDNSVALAINQLQFEPTMAGGSITFDDAYNGMLAELGLMLNRSHEESRNQQLILDQFKRLRNEISSVNMDEEVADMVQYQRGFEASAKFIKSIDEMTKTVIGM